MICACDVCCESKDCEIRKIQLTLFDDSIPLLNKIAYLGRMSILLQNGVCTYGLSDEDFEPKIEGVKNGL